MDGARNAANNGAMTRYVIDPLAAIELSRDTVVIAGEHQLVAPSSLRSQCLGILYRAVAWRIAEQLDWDDTANAEYIAVAQLQADAFITLDPELARQVAGVIELAPLAVLQSTDGP